MASLYLAIPVGAAAALWVLTRPKLSLALAVLGILWATSFEFLTGVDQFKWVDESAVALAVLASTLLALSRGRLYGYPGLWFFGIFLLCGAISSVLAEVESSTWLSAALLAAKGILVGWASAQIDWGPRDIRAMARVGAVVGLITALGVCLNLIVGERWTIAFAGYSEDRYGLSALVGPFTHPLALGSVASLVTVSALAWHRTFGPSRISKLLLFTAPLSALTSLRRTALIGLVVATTWTIARTSRAQSIALLSVGTALVTAFGGNFVREVYDNTVQEYFANNTEAARNLMTLGAIDVASMRFPFGSGFGRYGSFIAAEEYSPEYYRLGFSRIYGMTPEMTSFLTDTAWPSVLGETGWVGFTSFLVALALIFRSCRRIQRLCDAQARWFGRAGEGALVLTLVGSFSIPVFTAPPLYFVPFFVAGVAAALLRQCSCDCQEVETPCADRSSL